MGLTPGRSAFLDEDRMMPSKERESAVLRETPCAMWRGRRDPFLMVRMHTKLVEALVA